MIINHEEETYAFPNINFFLYHQKNVRLVSALLVGKKKDFRLRIWKNIRNIFVTIYIIMIYWSMRNMKCKHELAIWIYLKK